MLRPPRLAKPAFLAGLPHRGLAISGALPFTPGPFTGLAMALIVQKYGGTSVGSIDRMRNVAARVKRTRDAGNQVVAVVSAMSGITDGLIKMAKEFSEAPSEREMDVLLATGEQQSIALVSMAMHEAGLDAVSVTGRQAGIFTKGSHTRGRIQDITTQVGM